MILRKLAHCVRHPRKAYKEYYMQEKTIHRRNGLNSENTYYVIRCNLPECGFFAIYTYVLDHLAYALDKGYIPVLDIEQYDTLYKEATPVNGISNPWLYYFMPWNSITVEDCKHFANVIYSAIQFPHYKTIHYFAQKEKNVLPNEERLLELKKIIDANIQLKPELQTELSILCSKIIAGRKALGIHVRGTDMYTEGKHHPIPTGKTKNFDIVDEIIRKHDIEVIILCTDTESTIESYKEKYGDMVVTTNAVRQKDDSHTGIHKDAALATREHHRYLMGKEVLTDMYLLSKCDVLLCGPSNVPFIAMSVNGGQYDEIYYFA